MSLHGVKPDGLEVPFLFCLKPAPRFLQVPRGFYSHYHSQLLLNSHHESLWIVSSCFCEAWCRVIRETWLVLSRRHISLDCLISLPLLNSPLVTSLQFHIALVSPGLHSPLSFFTSSFLLPLSCPFPPYSHLPFQNKNKFYFVFLPAFSNFLCFWLLILMPSKYYLLPVNYWSIFLHNGIHFPFCMHPAILIAAPPHFPNPSQWQFLLSYPSLIVWYTNAMATLKLKLFLLTYSA